MPSDTSIFSWRKIIAQILLLVSVLWLVNGWINNLIIAYPSIYFGPKTWPINVFLFRSFDVHSFLFFLVLVIAGRFFFSLVLRKDLSLKLVLVIGFSLILFSNLVQGFDQGIINPISGTVMTGGGSQLYHEAYLVREPHFLSEFLKLAPTLQTHARTHPPGALIFMAFLIAILVSPAYISIALALMAIVLSGYFLYRILIRYLTPEASSKAVLLFFLIPAIQVYYLSTEDALVGALSLGVVWAFLKALDDKRWFSLGSVLSALIMFATLFLSFGAIFLFPVLFVFEILKKRRILSFLSMSALVVVGFIILERLTGYNYWLSFRLASQIENPHGFRLLSEPISYLFTRFEGISEILLFFSPFLIYLYFVAFKNRNPHHRDLYILSALGVLTLLAMFVAGAYRGGETARDCIFIYPFLLFPIATLFDSEKLTKNAVIWLFYLVFVMGLVMQIVGFYFW